MLRKLYTSEAKEVQGEERTLVVKISTATPDRSNDVVVPTGVVLDNYLKNPVVAAFHNYSKPPIGKATEIAHTADGVVAKVQFTPQGVNPEADMIYELNKGGFMNAWSIGFIPRKWADLQDGGRQFDQIELLEFSAVLVPDNPEALTILRSKGFNPDELETEAKSFNIDAEVDIEEKDEEEEEKENEEQETKDVEQLQKAFDEAKELVEKLEAENHELKEGRVLSDKNRKLVSSVKEQLDTLSGSLQKLLDATDSAPKGEEEHETKETDDVAVEFIKSMQNELRKTDKGVGLLLRSMNDYLKSSKSPKEGGE